MYYKLLFCFPVTIGGGHNSQVQCRNSAVVGGLNNHVSGSFSTIAGGECNKTIACSTFIGGGCDNQIDNEDSYTSVLVGGRGNRIQGHSNNGGLVTGYQNIVSSSCGVVLSGTCNCLCSGGGAILSGYRNRTYGVSEDVVILGGVKNTGSADNSLIGHGDCNAIYGDRDWETIASTT